MAKRIGESIIYDNDICIKKWASAVGKKEGEGPLKSKFDLVFEDTTLGEDSWEKSESKLLQQAAEKALGKAKAVWSDIDCIFTGDLLSQNIGSSFAFREVGVPIVGLYGACSTMALSLINAGNFLEADCGSRALAATGSHFCSSERQFRFPLEYGEVRTPTAQWTVTGAGAMLLEKGKGDVELYAAHIGKIKDLGITDANNMGAAMAPAAANTIAGFLENLNCKPEDFDAIITGDLGFVGSDILLEFIEREYGVDISSVHQDCGKLIFDREEQKVNAGGSGCGCSASVMCAHFLDKLLSGEMEQIMFAATGALLSPVTVKQSESIPSVAHAVILRRGKNE